MPFIPHTETDIREMLAAIGASSINALFDEIPAELRTGRLDAVPEGLAEMEVARLLSARAQQDGRALCFIGAGAYEHHIPAAVWEIVRRGEFYSAYTPYQAEASQGTLQLLYEFQTMMCGLTGLDVSNASLYDGASALSEAILMAVRAHKTSKSARILLPANVHPHYRQVASNIVTLQNITLESLPYCADTGTTLPDALKKYQGQDITALVIQQPNFFGGLEDVGALTAWAKENNTLVIAVVNPVSLALLKPPGQWGVGGADIACGEGQPLGSPLASGGPYFGVMCCKQEHVRQMPGRIIGRTVDLDGKPGYTLTLQAREQHIRRAKATSNICTNQGLLVTAATIHMSLLGPDGLERVAASCMANTAELLNKLKRLAGVELLFDGPRFHEAVIRVPKPAAEVLARMAQLDVLGGYDLGREYPELGQAMLVCATETKTPEDLDRYVAALSAALE
ncbi:MAG: aminomethyl-transferring glycine dehydrogenase subunit GcvPA [Nevskiales bacterium]